MAQYAGVHAVAAIAHFPGHHAPGYRPYHPGVKEVQRVKFPLTAVQDSAADELAVDESGAAAGSHGIAAGSADGRAAGHSGIGVAAGPGVRHADAAGADGSSARPRSCPAHAAGGEFAAAGPGDRLAATATVRRRLARQMLSQPRPLAFRCRPAY